MFDFSLGSGRVTFSNTRSFMKAVQAAFIEIRTPKFTKKVNITKFFSTFIDTVLNFASTNLASLI